METLSLPYTVRVENLKKELSSLGFNIYMYLTEGTLKNIDVLLILRDGSLECFKSNVEEISPNVTFQLINVSEEPRNIQDEVKSRFVFLSLTSPYFWGIGDSEEPFEPKKGQSFISIGDISEMEAFVLSYELSYMFGTKFCFSKSGDNGFILHINPRYKWANDIFKEIKNNLEEIRLVYKCVDIEVLKSVMINVSKDDFE